LFKALAENTGGALVKNTQEIELLVRESNEDLYAMTFK
jgi:hypothetical protein